MLDAVPSASGPPRPHTRSFVICVHVRRTPENGSEFSVDIGGAGIPSEPPPLPIAGTIPRDRSCRILCSEILRSGEIISEYSRSHAHCKIVRGLAPTSSSESSLPIYLGCMLSLMSAEQIIRRLGLPCIGKERLGASSCGASGARVPCDASSILLRTCADAEAF